MDRSQPMMSGFSRSGIFPFSPLQVEAVAPKIIQPIDLDQVVAKNQGVLVELRNHLRALNIADEEVARIMKEAVLAAQGKSQTDWFAEELRFIIMRKDDLSVPDLTTDRRLKPSEMGEILLQSDFTKGIENRKDKRKSAAKKQKPKKRAA